MGARPTLAERMDVYRLQAGETQRELSAALGMVHSYWTNFLNGKFLASYAVITKFCTHYDLPSDIHKSLSDHRAVTSRHYFKRGASNAPPYHFICTFCHTVVIAHIKPVDWRVKAWRLHCAKKRCARRARVAYFADANAARKLLRQQHRAQGLPPPDRRTPRGAGDDEWTAYDYGYGVERVRVLHKDTDWEPQGEPQPMLRCARRVVRIVRHG